jgi:high-affinity iron transporter
MRITDVLNRFALLGACCGAVLAVPAGAQEHPARRVASIVSVAVEEYGKAVDAQGRLISAQEYSETRDFLNDARGAAARLSGANAAAARALLDSIAAAVAAKRPPRVLDSLELRFAAILGNEAKLELPSRPLDLAEGKTIFDRSCASCHGQSGGGDGPAGLALEPHPPAIGDATVMYDVTPALMYRVVSVGIAGTPMAGFANNLTPEQRWNVVAYVNSLRSTHAQQLEGEGLYTQRCASCHGVAGVGDGTLARSLTKLPPEIGTVAWQVEHSDAQLAQVVRHGIVGTAMPPATDLSPPQVMSVVAYLRTLPTKDRSGSAMAVGSDSLSPQATARNVIAQLEQALSAAKSGRASDAGDKAFDAYIAFEPLERTTRAKNPGLIASMERQFAEFKAAVRSNDVRGAEGARDAIESTLPEVVSLAAPAGSGTEAFWQSFLIILREGFEAILVIGAIVAFLIKTGNRDRLRSIWAGVAMGVVGSAITAVILRTILVAVPASKEFVEGMSLLLAVVVLFSVSYWLISKVEAAKWQQFIKEKVTNALEKGGGRALAFVAFLAVYREGAETALFYQALFNEGPHVALPITLGIAAGFVALAIIFTLFYRFGVKIPLRPFFSVTSVLLYYMAFVFTGKGIKELQEGNLIPLSAIRGFPHVEWLGLYPSWQGVLAQLALLLLFAFAVLKTFWPKRSVSLPTVMPTSGAPEPVTRDLAALHAENDELRRRLAALEEAMGREPLAG